MGDINTLRKEIVQAFSPAWQLNDEAHREEHFLAVFRLACRMNKELSLRFDEVPVMLAAYFHDLFAWSRNNHHELSCQWMRTTDHPVITGWIGSDGRRATVAFACLEHRASFKGIFSNQFAELINSADRGEPGDVEAMLKRAMQYRQAKYPEMSEADIHAGSIAHLKEKYGSQGYARYPSMYITLFDTELQKQRQDIDNL